VATSRSTVHAVVERVPTSLLSFAYPLLEPTQMSQEGVPVAGLADIAAMKIEAIASRGARKDFYDLYFICAAGMTLAEAIGAFERRFASANPDRYHRMRALTYFDDAEMEPEPALVRRVEWRDVRTFFEEHVRAIWKGP
jgi:predicted nucleotidyltransferase component of viral defense system